MSDVFAPTSRYYGLLERSMTLADGSEVRFVGRRIIPALSRYRAVERWRSSGDERIDAIAAAMFGDPELYWRICDANGDADPGTAAAEPGRLLIIPLPLEIADDGDA